ncbi:MAG: LPP20 family lipoprotein [Nitrospirota bacterium]
MNRRRLGTLAACLAILVLACLGCSGSGWSRPPVWIEGASPSFPPDQYLVGVGQADSQPAAAERAYAAVARIFKAEVSAQSRDWESFLLFENRGTTSSQRRLTLDQLTRVSTDKVLENVRILDGWFDPKSGLHYALAGMNRTQAGAGLLERVTELDGKIETELQEARQSPDRLARLRNLRRAVKDLVVREAYNADLRVIRPSGRGEASPHRVAELTAELEQFLSANVAISVEVSGEQAEPVRRAVVEGLIREGLPVVAGPVGQDGGRADSKPVEFVARGTVRLWNVMVPDPRFRYVRWCSDFVVVEPGTQRIVGAVSRAGREGHLSEGEAKAKAVRVMQQELTSELARTLASYVYGDAESLPNPPPSACPGEGSISGNRGTGDRSS